MKWIYLIKAELEGIGYYKIGITSRTPEKRLKELQTGNALKLELVNVFPTKFNTLFESTLHRTYAIEKESGEWFSLSQDQVKDFLNTCQKIENNLKCISENNTFFDDKKWK
jgi:hypothetical protein